MIFISPAGLSSGEENLSDVSITSSYFFSEKSIFILFLISSVKHSAKYNRVI